MIMNVNGSDQFGDVCPHMGLDTKGFLVGWLGTRLSILIMYAVALYNNKHTLPQFVFDIVVSAILFLVGMAMFSPHLDRSVFYKIALPVEFVLATPLLGKFIRPYFSRVLGIEPENGEYYIVPVNILVYQRRLCMFIMMVLGEGVIQILDPTLNDDHLTRCYSYATCGLILLFSFAMLYCDAVLRENPDDHALRRSAFSGCVWVYMHGVLAFFMFLIGISIKLSYHDVVEDHQIYHQQDVLLGVSCGTVVLCLAIMRSRHKGSTVFFLDANSEEERCKKNKRIFNYSVRIFIAVFHWMAALQSFNIKSNSVTARDRYLYLHCALASSSVAFEVILSHFSGSKTPSKSSSSHHGEITQENANPITDNDL